MAGIGESMFARESTPIGDKETRRNYPIISPTPDKPGCKQWISNPRHHDVFIYLPSITEINIKPPEKGGEGEREKRRIHPIISPTWISNPCHHEARICPPKPTDGDLGKSRKGESTPQYRQLPINRG
jgi:hypothetical protein